MFRRRIDGLQGLPWSFMFWFITTYYYLSLPISTLAAVAAAAAAAGGPGARGMQPALWWQAASLHAGRTDELIIK